MHKFRLISRKGEGTFSDVIKAQDIRSSKVFALKVLKRSFQSVQEVSKLREVKVLKALSDHPNIVKLYEVVFQEQTGKVSLVMEMMDLNLFEAIRSRRYYVPEETVGRWMFQLLLGLDFLHSNGVFHRDIKPENLLVSGDVLKLADLGSCRSLDSKPPYTEYISTRWYRAPECLMTDGHYSFKMDIWAAGCVMFEVIALDPLFPGDNETDQIDKIHQILGSPTKPQLEAMFGPHLIDLTFPTRLGTGIGGLIPHASSPAVFLIQELVVYNSKFRCTASEALKSKFFKPEVRSAYSSTVYVVFFLRSLETRKYNSSHSGPNRANRKLDRSHDPTPRDLSVKAQWSYRPPPEQPTASLVAKRRRILLPPIKSFS